MRGLLVFLGFNVRASKPYRLLTGWHGTLVIHCHRRACAMLRENLVPGKERTAQSIALKSYCHRHPMRTRIKAI
jgi:hypothetical protein